MIGFSLITTKIVDKLRKLYLIMQKDKKLSINLTKIAVII